MVDESIQRAAGSTACTGSLNAGGPLTSIRESMESRFSCHFNPVIQFARNLPAYSGNMLELHFDPARPWFDFAFKATPGYDRPLLEDERLLNSSPAAVRAVYQQLLGTCKTHFRYGIENICFEYDAPFQTGPSVFFDIHRTAGTGLEKKYEDLRKITHGFDHPFPGELFDFLMKIKAIHLDAIYFGLMFSRKSNSVRLTINGIEPCRISETLTELGWSGNQDVVLELKNRYLHNARQVVLAVDFSDRLGNRIGIEVFDRIEGALPGKLYTNNLIEEEQYRLLQQWPGQTALDPAMAAGISRLHQRPVACLYRRINHVKFTVDDQLLNTKAYLYYCF